MDILNVGVDISGFSPDKLAVLKEYVSVFERLDSYDKTKFTPTSGEGLTAFNTSIKNTSALLDDLNDKIAFLNTQSQLAGKGTSAAAQSQTELGLAISEYNKQATAAATTAAKLSVAQSAQAKETSILKAQLKEVNTEINNNAKAQTQSAQAIGLATIKTKEYRIERQRVVDSLRSLAKQQDFESNQAGQRMDRKSKTEEKEYKARELEERRQMIAAYKAEIELEEQATRAKLAESNANKLVISDLAILKQSLKDQQINYSNNYINKGAKHQDTIAAKAEMQETANLINKIEEGMAKSNSSILNIGHSLTGAYSMIRRIAYILPGIGIAGIFNLAFEAIGAAFEKLTDFDSELKKQHDLQTLINEDLLKMVENYKYIYESKKKISDLADYDSTEMQKRHIETQSKYGLNSYSVSSLKVENDKISLKKEENRLGGKDKIDEVENEIKNYQKEYDNLIKLKNSLDELKDSKDVSMYGLGDYKRKRVQIYENSEMNKELLAQGAFIQDVVKHKDNSYSTSRAMMGARYPGDEDLKTIVFTQKQMESAEKNIQSQLDVTKKSIDENLKKYEDYIKAKQQYDDDYAEHWKINYDLNLKKQVEDAKKIVEIELEKNEKILSSDKSNELAKIQSVNRIYELNKQLNSLTATLVTGRISSSNPLGDNIEHDDREKRIALDKKEESDFKALANKNEKLHDINDKYRKIELDSITEIYKNEQELIVKYDEDINKDVHEGLEKRLYILLDYIQKRKAINEAEYKKELGVHPLEGMTDAEVKKINSDKERKDKELELEMPKKIYDTIMSWAKRELTDLSVIHKQKATENETAFMAELKILDDHYAAKLLSFRAYGEKLHQLEEKYRYVKPEQLNKAYADFKEKNQGDIAFATNKLHELDPKVTSAKKDLDYAKGTGDKDLIFDAQSTYDKLLKEKQGYEDALKEFEAKGDKTSEEYKKAKDESEKARANMMKKFYEDDMKNRHELAEKAFGGIKTVLDKEYQVRLEHAQLVKQITDEQYGNEIAAINKSALTSKDKAALDMQVAAQKMQFDKNMAAEERKIKHDQAITDRNLSIAHILWNTEESVSAALKMPPPYGEILAAERGLLGAVEIATVMATPIPYAEGTPAGGHPGGLAMYGEAGPELVKEPYKSPYIVTTETISYLPKGTEVIPILDSPEFGMKKQSDGWEQTRWLAKQIKKNSNNKSSTINNNINLGLGFEIYKNQILGN